MKTSVKRAHRATPDIVVTSLCVSATVVLGTLVIVLLGTDSSAPPPARHVGSTYYPEPLAKPGFALTKEVIGERGVAAYVLETEAPGAGERPAVILIHGGGITDALESGKPQYKGEWFIPLYDYIPYRLAEAGFLVIAIDAWWAGERHRPEHDALARANPIAALFHGWVETSHDVSDVIDGVLARGSVDPRRIGVAGRSGGGIVALMTACTDERVVAVVAWNAGADFVAIANGRGQGILMNQALADKAFREELQEADPIHHYRNIPPKALALIGNADDPLMPRQAAQALYDELLPLYTDAPHRLLIRFFETPQPTHELDAAAYNLGCEWLERHLGNTDLR